MTLRMAQALKLLSTRILKIKLSKVVSMRIMTTVADIMTDTTLEELIFGRNP